MPLLKDKLSLADLKALVETSLETSGSSIGKLRQAAVTDAVSVSGAGRAALGNALSAAMGFSTDPTPIASGALPVATASALGGVKVGAKLSIDGTGILSLVDTTFPLLAGGRDFTAAVGYDADKTSTLTNLSFAHKLYVDTQDATEATARNTADTALTGSLSTETSARISADSTLTTNLAAETSTRISADSTLTTNLAAETSTRISADTSLATAIAAEATARASADSALKGQFGAPVADATALAALPGTDGGDGNFRVDAQLRVVDANGNLYRFQAGDATTADGVDVVAPAAGTGRWFRVQAQTQNHEALTGVVNSGSGSEYQHLTTALWNRLNDAVSTGTASKLVIRDSSGDFSAGIITAALSGNATTATALATGRTIGMTGDVSWTSAAFTGAGDVTGTATLATVATPGTYRSVTVNAKGLTTAGTNPTTLAGYGITDAVSSTTSQTANFLLAAPNGTAGAPTFRALVAADVPTLNQNTTGSSGSCSGNAATASAAYGGSALETALNSKLTVVTSSGTSGLTGSGIAASPLSMTAATTNTNGYMTAAYATKLDGLTSGNKFLASPDGAIGESSYRAIVAADIPTLNQNTSGNAATATTASAVAWTGVTGKPATFSPAAHATSHTNGTDDVQLATSGQKGLMSSTYASKLDGIATGAQPGTVTGVTASSPLASSGGATPNITLQAATTSVPGSMSAADKTKLNALSVDAVPDGNPTEYAYESWATYDEVRKVGVFGLGNLYSFALETWEFDGVTWRKPIPTNNPGGYTIRACASYYATSKKTVLFGGGSSYNETWEWEGTNWSQRSPTTVPTGRDDSRMVADLHRGVLTMFGGMTWAASPLGDMYDWNNTDWTSFAGTKPGSRFLHGMAYDPVRKKIIVFGGSNNTSGYASGRLNDLWEFDSVAQTWSQILANGNSSGPSQRYAPAFFYSPSTNQVILYGGRGANDVELSDTWEWNGTNWTQLSPWQSPIAGAGWKHTQVDMSGNVVLFGPSYQGSIDNRAWKWNGSSWTL